MSRSSMRDAPIDVRTLVLAVVIHGGWITLTLFHRVVPPPLLVLLGGWLIAWHGSLQHEVIHGHPTPWRRVNDALGFAPLSLWLPFALYRQSHLEHHATGHLTDPEHDPESRYLGVAEAEQRPWRLAIARLQSTLMGRIVLGPLFEIGGFLGTEAGRLLAGDRRRLAVWGGHLLAVAAVLAWLHFVCGMSLGVYLLAFVYPGAALSLIRSFAEHRAEREPGHRVAVVEGAPLLGLLFLNNNLHAAHHDRPGLSWHRLPAHYAAHRERLLEANGGLVYAGYAEIFRRFLFRPHDAPVFRT